jgi:uncharacterized protein (DUF885 family)
MTRHINSRDSFTLPVPAVALFSCLLLAGCGEREGAEADATPPAPRDVATPSTDMLVSDEAARAFAAFVEDFLAAREEDRRSDLSAAHFSAELAQTRADLERLRSIDPERLSFDDRLDWRFAQSILRGREIRQAQVQSWHYDPRDYLQFRDLGMTVQSPGDPADKVDALLAILEVLPKQFRSGEANLEKFIPRFQELSLFMARGGLSLFENDVVKLANAVPRRREEILTANESAIAALGNFINFLETELPEKPEGDWAIGEAAYDALLRDELLLPHDSASLFEFAQGEFDSTVRELEALAEKIDSTKTWQELAVEIKNDYPAPDRMIEAHQEWVNKSRDHILENDLVPIPWKERVDVVPRARYLRKYSYYGNFSRAREANEDGVFVAQWMINPFEDDWDEQTKQEYLVEHDWGVIIVTAPHESYAGHHVQGLYQMHNPSAFRRENGLSLFSEGWGLYQEQLMRETGFFPDDRIVLRQLQLRLWRNARVVWDVGIHTGRMSYEESISLLSDGVGFLRWAAQLEVDGSARSPIYRLGYFLGMSEILRMREEYRARRGEAFTLSEFHENLLKVGNMPPTLMREGLMATLDN